MDYIHEMKNYEMESTSPSLSALNEMESHTHTHALHIGLLISSTKLLFKSFYMLSDFVFYVTKPSTR